ATVEQRNARIALLMGAARFVEAWRLLWTPQPLGGKVAAAPQRRSEAPLRLLAAVAQLAARLDRQRVAAEAGGGGWECSSSPVKLTLEVATMPPGPVAAGAGTGTAGRYAAARGGGGARGPPADP
ncbi:unnamed protein product, partial [Phaeothamnion confervicola]